MQVINTENPHVLGFMRANESGRILVFANFSEHEQHLPFNLLRLYGLNYAYRDLLSGEEVSKGELILEA